MSGRASPPESRHEWERLLRSLGFQEGRIARHGILWSHPAGTLLLPRLAGNSKSLDPCARKNLFSQLRRIVHVP